VARDIGGDRRSDDAAADDDYIGNICQDHSRFFARQ